MPKIISRAHQRLPNKSRLPLGPGVRLAFRSYLTEHGSMEPMYEDKDVLPHPAHPGTTRRGPCRYWERILQRIEMHHIFTRKVSRKFVGPIGVRYPTGLVLNPFGPPRLGPGRHPGAPYGWVILIDFWGYRCSNAGCTASRLLSVARTNLHRLMARLQATKRLERRLTMVFLPETMADIPPGRTCG